MRVRSTTAAMSAALFALAGCATRAAVVQEPAAFVGPATRVVELPVPAGSGQALEVRVLVEEPELKLVSIVLRQGTPLPEHVVNVPVTIQALQGTGTVTAGAERLRIDAAHAVVLAPRVPHSVEPDAGLDLVLLVHRVGRAEQRQP